MEPKFGHRFRLSDRSQWRQEVGRLGSLSGVVVDPGIGVLMHRGKPVGEMLHDNHLVISSYGDESLRTPVMALIGAAHCLLELD